MLIMLQAVLGFDNLLYISLESQRAPKDRQKFVRVTGISLAIVFRIILLFLIINLVKMLQEPFFTVDTDFFHAEFSGHAVITLVGGVFILYTAVKEIFHMINIDEAHHGEQKPDSVTKIITLIVIMNVIFSFDSILSAMAISDTFWVMATAIIIGGILMITMSDIITNFLKKNRMYEVLGLFILLIVGIMLLTEGGHLAHMSFFGNEIQVMTKTTFYFVIAVLVLTEIIQSRYKQKILAAKAHLLAKAEEGNH